MSEELKYLKLTDEEASREMTKRLKEIKELLRDIRDALRSAGGML